MLGNLSPFSQQTMRILMVDVIFTTGSYIEDITCQFEDMNFIVSVENNILQMSTIKFNIQATV